MVEKCISLRRRQAAAFLLLPCLGLGLNPSSLHADTHPSIDKTPANASPLTQLLLLPYLGTYSCNFLSAHEQHKLIAANKTLQEKFVETPRVAALKELVNLIGNLRYRDSENIYLSDKDEASAPAAGFLHSGVVNASRYFALTGQKKDRYAPKDGLRLNRIEAQQYINDLQTHLNKLWPRAYPGQTAPHVSIPTTAELGLIFGRKTDTTLYRSTNPWLATSSTLPYQMTFSNSDLDRYTAYWTADDPGTLVPVMGKKYTYTYSETQMLIYPIFRFSSKAIE